MSQADLARESGLSTGAVSMLVTDTRGAGRDACQAIAHAFKIPSEEVYRAAGLLPPVDELDEQRARIDYKVSQLDPNDQELVEQFAEMLLRRRLGNNAGTSLEKPE